MLTLYLVDRNKNVYFDEKSSAITFHLLPDVSPYSRDSRKLDASDLSVHASIPVTSIQEKHCERLSHHQLRSAAFLCASLPIKCHIKDQFKKQTNSDWVNLKVIGNTVWSTVYAVTPKSINFISALISRQKITSDGTAEAQRCFHAGIQRVIPRGKRDLPCIHLKIATDKYDFDLSIFLLPDLSL